VTTRGDLARQAAAERQRRRRERIASGKRRVVVMVDESLIEDALLRRGLLSPQDLDNPAAVAAAARDALTAWAEMQVASPPEPEVSRVTSSISRLW
jgi:hypothetical protein